MAAKSLTPNQMKPPHVELPTCARIGPARTLKEAAQFLPHPQRARKPDIWFQLPRDLSVPFERGLQKLLKETRKRQWAFRIERQPYGARYEFPDLPGGELSAQERALVAEVIGRCFKRVPVKVRTVGDQIHAMESADLAPAGMPGEERDRINREMDEYLAHHGTGATWS